MSPPVLVRYPRILWFWNAHVKILADLLGVFQISTRKSRVSFLPGCTTLILKGSLGSIVLRICRVLYRLSSFSAACDTFARVSSFWSAGGAC